MQLSGPEIKLRMQLRNPRNPDGKPNINIEPFDERCLGSNSYDLHLAPEMKVYKNTVPYGMKPFIAFDKNKKDYSMADWFYDSETTDKLTQTTFSSWKDLNSFVKDTNPDPNIRTPDVFKNVSPYFLCSVAHFEEYDIRNPKFLVDTAVQKETFSFEIPETGAILNPCMGYLGSTVEYTETYNLFPYIDGKSSLGRNFVLNHHTAGRGDDGFCGNWTLEIHCLYPTVIYPYMRIGQIYYEKFEGDQKQYHKSPTSHYSNQIGPTPAAPIPVDLFIKDAIQKQK